LIRKIDLQITQKGQDTSAANQAGYFQIVAMGTPSDKIRFFIGHFCAIVMGGALPTFQIFLADSFDAFADPDKDEQMKKINRITIIIMSLAAGMWVFGYVYWLMLSTFSLSITRKIKMEYLEAILR